MKKKVLLIIGIIVFIALLVTGGYLYLHREKYIYSDKIEKITIKYYPGYNIATAEAINSFNKDGDYISSVVINLEGEDFNTAKGFFSKIKPTDFDFDSCDCAYILDEYEVYLNDTTKISMGNEFGMTDEYIFDISEEFNNFITKLMFEYNNKNLYKSIESKSATIEMNGDKLSINEKDLTKLLSYKYYTVNNNEDYHTYDNGIKGSIKFDNYTVYLYGSDMAYLSNKDDSTYIVFVSPDNVNIYEFANNLIVNDRLKLSSKLNTDIIKVEQNGKTYEIKEKDKINEIVNELLYLGYSRPNFVLSMKESSFTKEDIKITFNKCRFYIPNSQNYGSRFFVDEDDKMYSVTGLNSSKLESTVKDLIK